MTSPTASASTPRTQSGSPGPASDRFVRVKEGGEVLDVVEPLVATRSRAHRRRRRPHAVHVHVADPGRAGEVTRRARRQGRDDAGRRPCAARLTAPMTPGSRRRAALQTAGHEPHPDRLRRRCAQHALDERAVVHRAPPGRGETNDSTHRVCDRSEVHLADLRPEVAVGQGALSVVVDTADNCEPPSTVTYL